MEQIPIFIPMDCIKQFPEALNDPGNAGLVNLEPTPLCGYRCIDIEANYMWKPNGRGYAFTQTLMCRYNGKESRFNYMMRMMQNYDSRFIVLLPRERKPYLIVGSPYTDIEVGQRAVEHQTFVLECPFNVTPFPYFPGSVDVIGVTVMELMMLLYG